MRLGALACIASLVACAQGIQSPETENLTSATDLGGASASAGAPSSLGTSGSLASAGSPVSGQSGAPSSAAGSGSSSAGSGSSSAGSSSGGAPSSAGSSSTGGSSAAGAGPTTGTCGHFQPGNMGPTLESKLEGAATGSMDSIYFSVKIDNVDDRTIQLSDLKFRYYLDTGALGTLMSDFYQKDITAANKTTRQLSADPTATVSDSYLEFTFPGSTDTMTKGEFLTLKIHTHNSMYQTHDQTVDYSFNSSSAFVPWCKIALYEQAPLAWGTPAP